MPCEGTAQLFSLTDFKSHLFLHTLLAELLTDEGGEETGVPGENTWPGDELQKMTVVSASHLGDQHHCYFSGQQTPRGPSIRIKSGRHGNR